MEILNFSHNWNNKLNCKSFTTIRLENSSKYKVGNVFDVHLKKQSIKKVMVLEVKPFFLRNLNEFMANLDTGYSSPETKEILIKMYPDINFDTKRLYFILLKEVIINE